MNTGKELSRRDFIKQTAKGLLSLAFASIPLFGSCVSTGVVKEEGPVHYPKLSGKKIQVPEYYGLKGCYTGISETNDSKGYEVTGDNQNKVRQYSADRVSMLEQYNEIFGKQHTLFRVSWPAHLNFFPMMLATKIIKAGSIPVIALFPGKYSIDDMINGREVIARMKYDAQRIKRWGERTGYGFFYKPLLEMNLNMTNTKKFIKFWNQMGNIFEDHGATNYVTFIWSPHVTGWSSSEVGSLEDWYPGDKYVDWLGLHGGSLECWDYPSFEALFKNSYDILCDKKFRNKPIKVVTAAGGGSYYKSDYIKSVLENIQKKFPRIKAYEYFNQDKSGEPYEEDYRLHTTPRVVEAYREALSSNPYFLGSILENGSLPEVVESIKPM